MPPGISTIREGWTPMAVNNIFALITSPWMRKKMNKNTEYILQAKKEIHLDRLN
jgi:hypothetical protein